MRHEMRAALQRASLLASISAAVLAAPPTNPAEPHSAEQPAALMRHVFSDERSFYLDSQSDVRLLKHEQPLDVRVCSDPRGHRVPLEVEHDGERANVLPGGCVCFEAKTVTVRPADRLTGDNDLSGTVAHRSPQREESSGAPLGVRNCDRSDRAEIPRGSIKPNPEIRR